MCEMSVSVAVSKAIKQALKKRRWSIATLAKALNKHENTIYRWRSGETTSFDLEALVQVFKWAGMSLDKAFGLGRESSTSATAALLSELQQTNIEIKARMERLEQLQSRMMLEEHLIEEILARRRAELSYLEFDNPLSTSAEAHEQLGALQASSTTEVRQQMQRSALDAIKELQLKNRKLQMRGVKPDLGSENK